MNVSFKFLKFHNALKPNETNVRTKSQKYLISSSLFNIVFFSPYEFSLTEAVCIDIVWNSFEACSHNAAMSKHFGLSPEEKEIELRVNCHLFLLYAQKGKIKCH